MAKFLLHGENINTEFTVDAAACSGLKKVAGKVIDDFNLITGEKNTLSEIAEKLDSERAIDIAGKTEKLDSERAIDIAGKTEKLDSERAIDIAGKTEKLDSEKAIDIAGKTEKLDTGKALVFAGIVGESRVLEGLEAEGRIDLSDVKGKWEVYKMTLVGNALVIAGSDRLGAIYGLFAVSELMGVSPLKYWADSVVPKKNIVEIEIDEKATKEPSVKYRGLFINDEWPCYGNWTMEHFGGFTAEMYDHVFELLLRLKGNYLWPAMWSSCFGLDGPGLLNYELATEYGIYVGNSHHEPCLRAGEEYSKMRGKDSPYGDAWNFHTNTEGITKFWQDSMDERGGYTSMVTVGMRGEADSKILGENATLKDNIDLLKKVIVAQKKILKDTEAKFNKTFPKVLALYKEVEPFYYGDENTEGLCDWDELDDVILMLCEDNYGYLRTVPDDKMRKHPAGFGMYYHVDYHGSPISYEWINSSPLTTMWEQMSQAYDYGVKSVWILNTGDLKHNEFPLSYFMNLAYDFEKYGTSAPNTTYDYTKQAIDLHFGHLLSKEQVETASEILTETVRLNGYRRPEALNSSIYNACHFGEADRILERANALEKKLFDFEKTLPKECKDAWYSLTGFQTRGAVTLIRMHIYGGKNELFAMQGIKAANHYADLVTNEISADAHLKKQWAAFKDKKWSGHEMESHVGFTKWNEDGCRYPLRMRVEPFDRPRLYVTRVDEEQVYDKVYGPCMRILVNDFEFEGNEEVSLRLSNMGVGKLTAKITVPENDWLTVSKTQAEISEDFIVTFTADRSKLTEETKSVLCTIFDGDTKVEALFTGRSMKAEAPKGAFLPSRHGYAILASDYAKEEAFDGSKWIKLEDYGVYGSAMKAYPDTAKYAEGKEPTLSFALYAKEAGEYTLQTDFAPTNPLSRANKLRYFVTVNGERTGEYNTVPDGYKAGEAVDPVWSEGALSHRRECLSKVMLKAGLNEITIGIKDPGLVPMKLYLYNEEPPKAYFGMPESICNN